MANMTRLGALTVTSLWILKGKHIINQSRFVWFIGYHLPAISPLSFCFSEQTLEMSKIRLLQDDASIKISVMKAKQEGEFVEAKWQMFFHICSQRNKSDHVLLRMRSHVPIWSDQRV